MIAERALVTGGYLPPVLPVVLYNGRATWTAPTDSHALFGLPEGSPLWAFQPQARYHLLDLSADYGSVLQGRDNLAALLFRLERRQTPAAFKATLDDLIAWFGTHPEYETLRKLFAELAGLALNKFGAPASRFDTLGEISEMVPTLSEIWCEEWKAEGRAEGRREGRAEGRREGREEGLQQGRTEAARDLVLRLLRRRFADIPNVVESRVSAASLDELMVWTERILDADSLDSVFETLR